MTPFEKGIGYRFAFSPNNEDFSQVGLHRFQYQQSFDEKSRWRLIAQVRDINNTTQYDELRVQYLWLIDKSQGQTRESAFRIDARTRRGSRPEQLALVWTNRWRFAENYSFTGAMIGNWQIGDTAKTGTLVEVRLALQAKLANGGAIALQTFSDMGKLTNMGSFNQQRHSAGFMYSMRVNAVNLQIGYLKGITSATTNDTVRFWMDYRF